MANLEIIKSYITRNPSLSNEDISIRLGISKKKIARARSEMVDPSDTVTNHNSSDKIIVGKNKLDVVDNPADSLKQKIRQLDQTFEISRKEFLIDPNADNAHNMSIMLNDIKNTLKELDSFTDLSSISDLIVQNILMTLTKNIMKFSYENVKKFTEDISQYLPKGMRYSAEDYSKSFIRDLGIETKGLYDNAIDELEKIVRVPLDKYRIKERAEPLKIPKKKHS